MRWIKLEAGLSFLKDVRLWCQKLHSSEWSTLGFYRLPWAILALLSDFLLGPIFNFAIRECWNTLLEWKTFIININCYSIPFVNNTLVFFAQRISNCRFDGIINRALLIIKLCTFHLKSADYFVNEDTILQWDTGHSKLRLHASHFRGGSQLIKPHHYEADWYNTNFVHRETEDQRW